MTAIDQTIQNIIAEVAKLVPIYGQNQDDWCKNDGNVSLCIIDSEGNVYGRMFGSDKIKMRETYRFAWMKASQVHITGIPTGEFERLAFNGQINEKEFGIARPDYIGYKGGLPVTLKSGEVLSIGFSGYRGITDIDIIEKAVAAVDGE